MPQAREILRRISSVRNTQQITRAMKMVAAAKLNRARARMNAMRPYDEGLQRIFRHIAVDLIGDEHRLLSKRPIEKTLSIVIAGDRGLCGGFNSTILKTALGDAATRPDVDHSWIAIGKRAASGLKKHGAPIRKTYFDVFEKLSFILSSEICDLLLQWYDSTGEDRIDEVYIVYNSFQSMLSQTPVVERLLPLDWDALVAERKEELAADTDKETVRPIYNIEPDPEAALRHLMQHHLSTHVYRATVESYAAELAARQAAMDSATNNADEMIDRLTLEYNRARQAGITAELLDIIGGANALD